MCKLQLLGDLFVFRYLERLVTIAMMLQTLSTALTWMWSDPSTLYHITLFWSMFSWKSTAKPFLKQIPYCITSNNFLCKNCTAHPGPASCHWGQQMYKLFLASVLQIECRLMWPASPFARLEHNLIETLIRSQTRLHPRFYLLCTYHRSDKFCEHPLDFGAVPE